MWLGWPSTAVVAALATALSWRHLAWRIVYAGLPSWQAGLTLGFVHHLQWGPQVVFTFGPYGVVEDILPFARSAAALALVYAVIVTWGLAGLIVSGLRRSWGLLPAGTAAWLALVIAANKLEAPELALATALGMALVAVDASSPERRRLSMLVLLGALAGFQFVVEVNVGLVTAGLAVLAVLGRDGRWRAAGATAVPFVVVPVVALVAAGQSLSNLGSYLHGSFSVAAGYASAMGLSGGRQAEDWYAVVDLALLAIVFALGLRGRRGAEQAVISLALAGWSWEAVKEGFVRHDLHDLVFFGLVLVALCLARLPRPLVPVQAVAIGLAALFTCLANAGPPISLHSPIENVTAFAQDIGDVVVPSHWAAVERVARKEVLGTGDTLSPGMVSALQGHTLAVEPLEDAVTFAYPQLHWDPEPVLQAYSAYTPYLDNLDARFLASAGAPDRILYRPSQVSGRNPAWDPPSTMEAMYCRYAARSVTDNWLVLARVPDRCGPPQLIGRATAHFGQWVAVPAAPGRMVVATFSLSTPLAARLEGVLLKPPAVTLVTGRAGRASLSYSFVSGTAGQDHVVAPGALGYPAGFGPAPVHELELTGGGWRAGQGTVSVSFYSLELSPSPRTHPLS